MAGLLGDVLPWAFSQGDRAKRYVNGLLADPAGTIMQTVNDANDRAGGLLAQTGAAAQERGYGPATQALAGTIASGYGPAGITVFRAGGPKGMTAAAGGPTFYSTETKGTAPFERYGPTQQYDINPASVLDTQLPQMRAIYEQFMAETKHPAGYGNTGRPYWTAEYDLRNWLQKNGHEFDAVMFDEPTRIPSYAVYGE